MDSPKKFQQFQGLRSVAFFFIFWSHADFLQKSSISSFYSITAPAMPTIGVMVFFVLSGFLTGCKLQPDDSVPNIGGLAFGMRRVKKYYLLHILTMTAVLVFKLVVIIRDGGDGLWLLLCSVFTQIFLVQSFIPIRSIYFSLNAASWYLSDYTYLSFLTIPCVKAVKKLFCTGSSVNRKGLAAFVVVLFFVEFIYAFLFRDNQMAHFLIYIFPPFRFLDYLLGIIIGFLFVSRPEKQINAMNIFTAICCICLVAYAWIRLRYILCAPAVCALIYCLAFSQGTISRILSSKYLVWLGDISLEAYLFHQIILGGVNLIMGERFLILQAVASLAITLSAAGITHRYITPRLVKLTASLKS